MTLDDFTCENDLLVEVVNRMYLCAFLCMKELR